MSVAPIAIPVPAVSLLELEPDFADWIPAEDRSLARRALRVPEMTLEPGRFDPQAVFRMTRRGFGALVAGGLISREIAAGNRPALRLLGPGDIFVDDPALIDGSGPVGAWRALTTTRLAILDDSLLVPLSRWPRLVRAFTARMQQTHNTTLLQLSISHQSAVEDRILGMFEMLAARWGRISARGVVVPVALTHDVIGQMIGARRPTVTLGLQTLALQGRLLRESSGRWLLGEGQTFTARDTAAGTDGPRGVTAA